jgi:hypothetical protein
MSKSEFGAVFSSVHHGPDVVVLFSSKVVMDAENWLN